MLTTGAMSRMKLKLSLNIVVLMAFDIEISSSVSLAADPVRRGCVSSRAGPGGNLSGDERSRSRSRRQAARAPQRTRSARGARGGAVELEQPIEGRRMEGHHDRDFVARLHGSTNRRLAADHKHVDRQPRELARQGGEASQAAGD